MKGQSKEIVEIAIIVALIVFVALTSLYFMRNPTMTKQDVQIEERNLLYNSDAIKNMFYTKLPTIDKTISQIISDRVVSDDDMIFYGEGYGYLNSRDIIEKYFTDYYGNNWHMALMTVVRDVSPMWIPNANPLNDENPSYGRSVSKLSSEDGREMGRYYTTSLDKNGNPSRIAIDSKGNAWVGNRNYNSVVKIGLNESNSCIDKNGDGIIRTSYDANKNMIIDKDEILNFGEDECLLLDVIIPKQNDGVYVRAVCVDSLDNVYVGMYDDKKLFYINGRNGEIIKEISIEEKPYGCFVDKNNIVWISTLNKNILYYKPSSGQVEKVNFDSCTSYGIAPCIKDDCMVVNCFDSRKIIKLSTNPSDRGRIIFQKGVEEFAAGKGIIVDEEDNIYAVFKSSNAIVKLDKDGNIKASSETCFGPHGVGIDSKKSVWVACEDSYMYKFDENLNYILSSMFGSNHYVYNFFTDYNLKISKAETILEYGNAIPETDKLRTFHVPIPLPSYYGMYAEVILYVW